MAATLLHIKSKLLLPSPKREKEEDEPDPGRAGFKAYWIQKYKRFTEIWNKRKRMREIFLQRSWGYWHQMWGWTFGIVLWWAKEGLRWVDRKKWKKNEQNTGKMTQIVQHEKVTLRSKIKISSGLFLKSRFQVFGAFFSKNQIQTWNCYRLSRDTWAGKTEKNNPDTAKTFADITVCKCEDTNLEDIDDENVAAENWQQWSDTNGSKETRRNIRRYAFASGDKVSIEKLSSITALTKRQ